MTGHSDSHAQEDAWVRLAIPREIVERVLEAGMMCAADVRCLDIESKHALQRLCLERCARCLKLGDAIAADSLLGAANGDDDGLRQDRRWRRLDRSQGSMRPERFR